MLRQSPILQDKYQWQEEEYRRTQKMEMREYIRFVKQEVKNVLNNLGYTHKEITPGIFRITPITPR